MCHQYSLCNQVLNQEVIMTVRVILPVLRTITNTRVRYCLSKDTFSPYLRMKAITCRLTRALEM